MKNDLDSFKKQLDEQEERIKKYAMSPQIPPKGEPVNLQYDLEESPPKPSKRESMSFSPRLGSKQSDEDEQADREKAKEDREYAGSPRSVASEVVGQQT